MKAVLAAAMLICAGLPVQGLAGDWVLAQVDGVAVSYAATLDLSQAGRMTGQAPCNHYFADVLQEGAAFMPGPIGATRMACPQMAEESDFLALLGAARTIEQTADRLVLRGSGFEMVFLPEPE